MLGTSEFLLGLTAQSAEADDTIIVEDLRSEYSVSSSLDMYI